MVGRTTPGPSKGARSTKQEHAGSRVVVRLAHGGQRHRLKAGSNTAGKRALPLPRTKRSPLSGRTLPKWHEAGRRGGRDGQRRFTSACVRGTARATDPQIHYQACRSHRTNTARLQGKRVRVRTARESDQTHRRRRATRRYLMAYGPAQRGPSEAQGCNVALGLRALTQAASPFLPQTTGGLGESISKTAHDTLQCGALF